MPLPDRFLDLGELGCAAHRNFNERVCAILDPIHPRPEGPRAWEHWAAFEGVTRLRAKRILDFGSYFSATPFVLAATGAKVVASDTMEWPELRPECQYPCKPTDWLASLSAEGIEFERWSHTGTGAPDKSFMLATSISTLEHIPDWRAAVREMLRVSSFQIITVDCSCEGRPYEGYDRLFSRDEVLEIAEMVHGKPSPVEGDCSVLLPTTTRSLAVIRNLP